MTECRQQLLGSCSHGHSSVDVMVTWSEECVYVTHLSNVHIYVERALCLSPIIMECNTFCSHCVLEREPGRCATHAW